MARHRELACDQARVKADAPGRFEPATLGLKGPRRRASILWGGLSLEEIAHDTYESLGDNTGVATTPRRSGMAGAAARCYAEARQRLDKSAVLWAQLGEPAASRPETDACQPGMRSDSCTRLTRGCRP